MDRAPAASAGTFSTREPSLYEAAIKPWDVTVDLRQSKHFQCDIAFLKLDGITIYRDRYGSAMRLQGVTPPATLTLCIPVGGLTDSSTFWGKAIDGRGIYPTFYRELESNTSTRHDQFIILINTEAADSSDLQEIVDYFDRAADGLPLFKPASAAAALRRHCQALLDSALHATALDDPAVAIALRNDLISAVTKTLPKSQSRSSLIGRKENAAIATMFEYLASSPEPVLSISRLCRTAGIGERTLERAVKARFDCTLQALLRRRRFHEARRRLLFADGGASSVTRVSYDLGFHDCGRFARDYFDLFGELPSRTLKAAPVGKVDALLEW